MSRLLRCILVVVLAVTSHLASARLSESDKQAVVVTLRQNTGAEYIVTVDLGKQRYRFVTLISDYESDPEGVKKQRALMGWKGEYLFLRQQCSSLLVWRCVVDQVFTRHASSLVHLGNVESRDCNATGCRFDEASGVFSDIYDGLETNPVTGQVDTPPLKLARRVDGGKLVSDLGKSWDLNATTYAASVSCLVKTARLGFGEKCEAGLDAWSALTFAAKLTHYVGRSAERAHLFDVLAVGYCAKSADPGCAKRAAGVKDHFSRFPPGEAPRYMPYPVAATNVDATENSKLTPQKFESGKAMQLKL